MNIRLFLFLLFGVPVIGFVVVSWGWGDYQESKTASEQPDLLDLADLEKGKQVSNNHVRIGSHAALYFGSVYTYKTSKNATRDPGRDPTTSITAYFYPIVSSEAPSVKALRELEKKHGSFEKIPDDELTTPSHFAVVVKTERYKKVVDIDSLPSFKIEPQVQGLILNHSKLGSDETKLLQQQFPTLDLNKVVILEDSRTPSSTLWCWTRIAMGIGIMVIGVLSAIGLGVRAVVGKQ